MPNVGYERRKAVANAWKQEKALVTSGKGTRDWSRKEQRQILSVGKAKGYEGHHMKSVDGHTTKAGDANNIQFLNRREHLAAHRGNFHNNTNGKYDPVSGKTEDFGRYKPVNEGKALSQPLSPTQIKAFGKSGEAGRSADRAKAKATPRRTVHKTAGGPVVTSSKSKTLAKQRSAVPVKVKSATPSKTLTAQRRNSGGTAKSATVRKSNSHPH